jgi:hypothetical protein
MSEAETETASHEEVAGLVVQLLKEKSPMLSEYLGLQIDVETAHILTLPLLLDGHRYQYKRFPLNLVYRVYQSMFLLPGLIHTTSVPPIHMLQARSY